MQAGPSARAQGGVPSRRRGAGAGVCVATLLVALLGCGQGVRVQSDSTERTPQAHEQRDESGPGAGPPSGPPVAATPAPTAGPLSWRQLPSSDDLGEGWSQGTGISGESGVPDNGTPTRRRDGAEVVAGLTPVGCPREAVDVRLPLPRWALEGTYRGPDEAPGVALALVFADRRTAGRFLDGLAAQVHACPAPATAPSATAPPVLTFTPLPSRPGTLTAWRREVGVDADPNRYLLVAERVGRRVALVYVARTAQQERFGIAEALRAAVAR